jgi:hypothetical protein
MEESNQGGAYTWVVEPVKTKKEKNVGEEHKLWSFLSCNTP